MKRNNILLVKSFLLIFLFILNIQAFAFHPLSTDDPGTTEHRHFELEWGNDLIFPEDKLHEFTGYVALKGGLTPRLEFDAAVNFAYAFWDETEEEYTSGWGDTEMLLKYRFYGDGEGPFNIGAEAIVLFPSGEADKGLSEGNNIVPTTFLFWTVGHGPVLVMFNAGVTFVSEENDTMLYGSAIQWSVSDKWNLIVETFGESDFEKGGGNDPLAALAGAVYSATDWLTLSVGAGMGLAPDSPDFNVTFSALTGW